MLTTPVVIADLMWQALQEQTMELMAALSTVTSQRLWVLVIVPPENIKDSILEADGL